MGILSELLTPMSGQEQRKRAAWNRAQAVSGTPLRKDTCGAWICWENYGDTNSQYGWEIDHISPASLGGSGAFSNLQALHWQNNRAKSNSVGINYCVVRAA